MRLTDLAHDAARRAVAGAQRTTLTLVRIDLVGQQLLALARRAALLIDVRLVLVAEVLEGACWSA